jgi:signal transduction histidine kinase
VIGGQAATTANVSPLWWRPGIRHLGWALAAMATATVVASRLLLAFDPYVRLRPPGPPVWLAVTGDALGPLFGVVTVSVIGAVVISREPASRLGWTLLGTSLAAALTLLCEEYAIQGLVAAPGSLPLAEGAAWTQRWSFDLLLLGLVLGLLLFPDGRLSGRGSRVTAWLAVAATLVAIADSFGDPALLQTSVRDEGYPLPVTMPTELWVPGSLVARWLGIPGFWAHVLLLPMASVTLLLRLRGAGGEEQRQIKWVAFAGAFAAVGWLLSYLDEVPRFLVSSGVVEPVEEWSDLVWTFGVTVLVPVALAFAVLRYRLYEIDRVVNRTVLVGGLAVFITGVYVTVAVGVGSAVGHGPLLSLVATAIAAVGFAPMRSRLQLLANRLVYGPRATPYEVLTNFAERLGSAYADDDVLAVMARLVGEGLGADRSQVWLRVGSMLRLAAAWPSPPPSHVALALSGEELPDRLGGGHVLSVRDRNELLGALEVSKAVGDRLSPDESRLLEDLARQAALILRTLRLIEELRTSRERMVSAHDEERRRLERDLHDGAQQRLATALVAMSMLRSDLEGGRREAADRALGEAYQQLTKGLAELRDLARGIHPAIVTDSGLAAAIESLVEVAPMPVALDLRFTGRLPAAVETTGYFLVSEALANVTKHARAASARVTIGVEGGRLLVEVADEGVGGADPAQGSGLRGLEDRLAALGGCLRIESPHLGGTRLLAELPCE